MTALSGILNLPYAHLNLRKNPFGELSAGERTALAVVDVDDVVARLKEPKYAIQFVGEKGYGKTTHLLAIRSHFPNSGYVHIPEGQRAVVPEGSPVLIDEAQRLKFWQRLVLFRTATPLVLGTHHDFADELRRAGRTVETVSVEQGTDVERLHCLLHARIISARRSTGPIPSVTLQTASELLQRFGPNIRGILHELYVRFQNLPEIRNV